MSFIRAAVLATLATLAAPAAQAADWLFLDLGEVIVTGSPATGYTYVPGAREWVQARRAEGYKVALLSNIPEAWGAACDEKFFKLQDFLAMHLNETEPMDWSIFDSVVLPPYDRYRKPEPFLFVAALDHACGGKAAFIGEHQLEIDVAKSRGLATHLKVAGEPMPEGQALVDVMSTFSAVHPDDCDYTAAMEAVKKPEDAGVPIGACVVTP